MKNKYLNYILSIGLIIFGVLFAYYQEFIDFKAPEDSTISYSKNTKLKKSNITRLNATDGDEDYTLTSDKYEISDKYIYYGTDSLGDVRSNVTCTNCSFNILHNQLDVIYEGNVVKTYDLVGISSDKYDLSKDYIFNSDFNLIYDITCTNCTLNVNDNQLEIIYDENVIKTYDLVNVTVKNYTLLDTYIYHGFESADINMNKISCTNCIATKNNDKVIITYKDKVIKEYTLLGLTTTYKIVIKTIYVQTDYGDDEKIINNINSPVCSLEIKDNNRLIVKYKNMIIDSYSIGLDEGMAFAQDYIIDENRMILYGVNANTSAGDLVSVMDPNTTTVILNKDYLPITDDEKVCTGYILRTITDDDPDNPVDYKISVPGDVLSTGGPSIENAKEIAKHIVDGNVIVGEEFLLAADYNGDGVIKMNDVTKMLIDLRNPEDLQNTVG